LKILRIRLYIEPHVILYRRGVYIEATIQIHTSINNVWQYNAEDAEREEVSEEGDLGPD
jgi:hypothetical protein